MRGAVACRASQVQQEQQLSRVSSNIARTVYEFCESRYAACRDEFHADELRAVVARKHNVAPGSADRILRNLRAKGIVQYTVTDRAKSLYRLDNVHPAAW